MHPSLFFELVVVDRTGSQFVSHRRELMFQGSK